jgi:hypothetical protein
MDDVSVDPFSVSETTKLKFALLCIGGTQDF